MKLVPSIFESFKIRSSEVHADGLITLPAIGNYLQEIAGDSAQQLGFSIEQLIEKNITWVLTRLKIELNDYPKWRETIQVETWPSGYDRMVATRDFRIWNAKKECVGKATSIWMLLDLNSRRPVNVEPVLAEFAKENPDRALVIHRDDRLDLVENPTEKKFFNVRYGDLDLNNHVNNVHFMEWVLEAVPATVREAKKLQSLDIQFRAECFYGDRIESQAEFINETNIRHFLKRESDQKEVARAQTTWR
jgi:acyl-ACP thioesterase